LISFALLAAARTGCTDAGIGALPARFTNC